MASHRAREVVAGLDNKDTVPKLAHETLTGTMKPSTGQYVSPSEVLQQHAKGIPTGSTAGTSPSSFASAGPMQAAPAAAPPAATGATGSSSVFKQSSTSQAGGGGAGAGGSASTLSSVTTGKGPLVLGSVEEGAQAQQVLQVLDNYDFRIYGQGLMAGADAVPLTPPNHKVLITPTPEETVEAPLPDTQQQRDTHTTTGRPAATATGATATGAMRGTAATTRTPSGTPALMLQPQPQAHGSSSSKLQGALQAAAAAALPPAGASAAAAAAGPDAAPVTSPVSSTTQAQQLKQTLQQQAPTGALGTSLGGSPGEGLRQRHAKQQQGTAGYLHRVSSSDRALDSSGSSGGFFARLTGSVSGFWGTTKRRVQAAFDRVVDEVLYALWTVLQWLLWLVVAPIKAVMGPWYNYNRSVKARSAAHLSQPFDIAELQELLGALPSWLSGIGGATEDMDWLNTLLAQVWPVLDPVVCELVRTSIEPLLDDMKPPFIAKMGFQKLTLGELPVELKGIRLVGNNDKASVAGDASVSVAAAAARAAQAAATSDDRLEIEVDFHWVGEPNISFFVELALAGPYTRLVPKVSNLTAQGTLRLGLTRLVPQLPGFGALLVSCADTPQIKFTLDFGPALGGKVTAKPVANFLDPFLRSTLAGLLVWPNRFVVPLLPREVTGNLDSLALHSVGVMEVEVLSAHHLPKKGGILSTVDPQVELWTQPQHRVHSAVKKNRRNPKWKGQVLEVLVQEPDSQLLRVVMHDIDMLNVQELFRLNVVKGATNMLRSANPIGFAALPLREVCSKPFTRQEVEIRLAGSEWAYELGVVGEDEAGSLNLAVTYRPFQDLDASSRAPIHARGALFVTVRQCQELPAGDWDSSQSDPYVLLKVAGQKQQTVVMPHSRSPIYNSHHEFFNVQLPDVLTVQVWDRDFLKPDDLLGQMEVPIKTIVTWTQGGVRGMRDGWWRLKGKKSEGWDRATGGRIEMKVQFRPYST